MYAWIWRHLPFGLWGKLAGSLVLTVATAALLWYVVFPWAEPILPFYDGQITQGGGAPGAGDPGIAPAGSGSPSVDPYEIPYSTEEPQNR